MEKYKHGDIASGNWQWAVGFPPPHEFAKHSHICSINSYALRRTQYDSEQVASLFAAAPDMLAALKYVRTLTSALPDDSDTDHAIHLIDDAIAKAEGRS